MGNKLFNVYYIMGKNLSIHCELAWKNIVLLCDYASQAFYSSVNENN